jgi:hypothetical protein
LISLRTLDNGSKLGDSFQLSPSASVNQRSALVPFGMKTQAKRTGVSPAAVSLA